MNYEIINDNSVVIFSENIDDTFLAAKKVAKELNLNFFKETKDFIPTFCFKNKKGNSIFQFLVVKTGDEDYLAEQPNTEPLETTEDVTVEKPMPEMTDEIISQYQLGLNYARKAIGDIIDEFTNEIVLRELLLNTYREGRSTLDIGSGIIKPLVQKALKGKVQKPFTPYGKGSKKQVKEFMQGIDFTPEEITFLEKYLARKVDKEKMTPEENALVAKLQEFQREVSPEEQALTDEALESVDRYFSKMQKSLSKKDIGGIGITSDEEAKVLKDEQSIFEKGINVLNRLRSLLKQKYIGSPKNFYGENATAYTTFLDTLFSLVNTTYMIFAEQKYEYRDDMATYLQVTSEKAEQFIEDYKNLITYYESLIEIK